jgi:hypothetical protein
MIQQRVKDPTGTNDSLWASPMRDLAHNFPYLVRAALDAMDEDLKKLSPEAEEQAGLYAQALAAYINQCPLPESPDSSVELMKKLKMTEFPEDTQRLFGKWMTRVLLGAYWVGIRNALHPGEKPLGVKELTEYVN